MNEPPYTTIPDTSDSVYWEMKTQNGQDRTSTFVPRDKELHQRLKKEAWKVIQTAQSRKRKNY